MNTMNKLKLSGLAGALLVALFSAQAHATKPGYVVDQSTDAVTRNSYGECWKTTYFDKANGLVECGDAVAPAPAAFTTADGIRVNTRIHYDTISTDSIYIIYYTEADLFKDSFTLTPFYDWYVAVPK